MELKNAIALVTGGGEGIGRGIAEALKAEGRNVTITGRREDALHPGNSPAWWISYGESR